MESKMKIKLMVQLLTNSSSLHTHADIQGLSKEGDGADPNPKSCLHLWGKPNKGWREWETHWE